MHFLIFVANLQSKLLADVLNVFEFRVNVVEHSLQIPPGLLSSVVELDTIVGKVFLLCSLFLLILVIIEKELIHWI
jgi:hypothetical protein